MPLKGWERFDAGLDTEGDENGTHSVFKLWRLMEVITNEGL